MTDPIDDNEMVTITAHNLTGGSWLAAAREWLQWKTVNGDSVTWGSHDEVRPTFTVKMAEELAAHVAAAAINEERARAATCKADLAYLEGRYLLAAKLVEQLYNPGPIPADSPTEMDEAVGDVLCEMIRIQLKVKRNEH